jgi:hypothetical protein
VIRCGGPCNQQFETEPHKTPDGWRYVESRDPNAPRIELTAAPGQGVTIGPGSNPRVAMCPACADVAEMAEFN